MMFFRDPPAGQPMRPALRWLLGLAVAVSGMSLLIERNDDGYRAMQGAPLAASDGSPMHSDASGIEPSMAINELERAAGDPFALPAVATAPAPPPSVPLQQQSPPPSAPPMTYRYLGQFTDPQGAPKIYVTGAGKDVLVEVGTQLEGGYEVVAITTQEIQLIYPALQQKANIPIPLTKPGF